MATHEHSINVALAEVLRTTRHTWAKGAEIVRAEPTSALQGSAKRPDILVEEPNTSPVVVETEIIPAGTLEADALSRLGAKVRVTGQLIVSTVAVRTPKALATLEGKALRAGIINARFECAMYTGSSASDAQRFPPSGWITLSVSDLSALVQAATVPPSVIDEAANALIDGVQQAAGILAQIAKLHPGALLKAATILRQADGEQTRRMIATIITDALLFQEVLAGGHGPLAKVLNLDQIVGRDGHLTRVNILDEWRKILKVNYWPIFDVARRLLETLPLANTTEMLTLLQKTVSLLLSKRVMRSHDLTGAVFQRLIADRKFLAAYYTTPAAASLVAGLAIKDEATPGGKSWSIKSEVAQLRIADFACGTGTLLSTAYRRISQLHESAGGNMEALHPHMMEQSIAGCDVLPAAAHLTASMLSGLHPSSEYGSSGIHHVAFGLQKRGGIALGALDLLDPQSRLQIVELTAKTLGGKGSKKTNIWTSFPPAAFDLVIMNPPFTRDTNHEGNKRDVANPAFAAFGTDVNTQKLMAKRLGELAKGTAYHGNAGEGSAFVALADRQLKADGTLAFILPLSVLSGEGWRSVRATLSKNYGNICVGSIAAAKARDAAFSADTDIAEAIIVAEKGAESKSRGHFFVLTKRPATQLHGAQIAQEIQILIQSKKTRQLESGPVGGDLIRLGNDKVGELLSAPISGGEPWRLNRVADLALAQAAYQLCEAGKLWLPGMPAPAKSPFGVRAIRDLGKVGPLDRDINEATESKAGVPRGPFEIRRPTGGSVPTYPALWAHDAKLEKKLVVEPDNEAVIRASHVTDVQSAINVRAAIVWATASNVHFNRDFQFNSQALGACYTTKPALGGRAWPSVCLEKQVWEKALVLWCNTSLGLLCHWWQATKVQTGRGSITLSALPLFKVFDLSLLEKAALAAAVSVFDEFSEKEFLPVHEIAKDDARIALDEQALTRVFGIDKALLEPGSVVSTLRAKMAAEPSINGGKRL
jgi:hypothetical protein